MVLSNNKVLLYLKRDHESQKRQGNLKWEIYKKKNFNP